VMLPSSPSTPITRRQMVVAWLPWRFDILTIRPVTVRHSVCERTATYRPHDARNREGRYEKKIAPEDWAGYI